MRCISREFAKQLADEHWNQHLTYRQLAELYPGYDHSTIAEAVKELSPNRKHQLWCKWCKKSFLARLPQAKFCSKSCRDHNWYFHNRLDLNVRPPN